MDDLDSIWADSIASDDGSDDPIANLTNADINMGDHEDVDAVDEDGDDVSDGNDDADGDESEADSDDTAVEDSATDESVFDLSSYKDQKVKVKINGVETEVALGEAINGYMRQADYTQKTQANAEALRQAEWAAQLQHAIQTDPAGTIQYLAKAYGLDVAGSTSNDPFENIDPEFAPLVQTVKQQEQMLAQMQAQLAQQTSAAEEARYLEQAQRELWDAKQEFPDMDERVALQVALDRGVTIREAHLLMQAEAMIAQRKAEATAKAKAEKTATVEARKRAQQGKTLKGSSAAGKAKDAEPEFASFGDLLEFEFSRNK
ncbi:hypothetical protein [Caudoviricetes sp.]|nr:hypothetical protein [Caudoviricetes sp.]